MTEFKYFLMIAFFSILGLLMCIFGSGCGPTPQEKRDEYMRITQACEDRCRSVGARDYLINYWNDSCTCQSGVRYRILQNDK